MISLYTIRKVIKNAYKYIDFKINSQTLAKKYNRYFWKGINLYK